jgi:hypothetical protein
MSRLAVLQSRLLAYQQSVDLLTRQRGQPVTNWRPVFRHNLHKSLLLRSLVKLAAPPVIDVNEAKKHVIIKVDMAKERGTLARVALSRD